MNSQLNKLPCGGVAISDYSGEIHDGHACFSRCNLCYAVIGSVGMPDYCKQLLRETKEND